MLAANRSIPACAVIPEIGYRNVAEAVQWLAKHFGFTERLRIANHRAQMIFGDGAIVVTEHPGPSPQSLLLRVDDIDARCHRAAAEGIAIVRAIATYPYGERQFTVRDLGGHIWTFTQTVFDADPATWGGVLFPVPARAD